MRLHKRRTTAVITTVIALAGVIWVNGGDLSPPAGPVAATMKPLDQVEPRMPISSLPATLGTSGSYYLTRNLTGAAGQNGITISADNVTVDLEGFALIGVSGSLDGILVSGPHVNIAVRNGTVRNWGGAGVNANSAQNAEFEKLRASNNTGDGLKVGSSAVAADCAAISNGGSGMVAGDGGRITGCVVSTNTGQGFLTGAGSTLESCAANANTGTGISAANGCVIRGCPVYGNGAGGIALNNSGVPLAPNGGLVEGCDVYGNAGNGIVAGSRCLVRNNEVAGSTLAGINVTGSACRIEGNHCTGGQRGLHIAGTDNLIVRNSVQGTTMSAYDIAAGNHDAARITSPGAGFASTSPWANFSF
jgi:hypothetical protein